MAAVLAGRNCHCVSRFCEPCRGRKLAVHQNSDVAVLKDLVQGYFPAKIERDLNRLYKDTLECVVVCKAYKDAVMRNSPYTYLKTHLKKVEGMSDFHATPLASLANEGSKVYEKWDTIEFNLVQCQLIDRRRFSINQFYRATELSWCYKYEESIRKKNSKPKRPFYEDEKYERIKNFIKDSGILSDLDHDPKQITALCSRLQSDLVKNPR